ncbi:DNA adenine methylase [Photobacterium leiognathi]|uniref:DNA adenine methylase n=1 Tax=Photobacterium leiognathi TaxID=553611 RepID=UPI0029819031|nr:DNA adenine methylase [Photobacterium leiognathi]
MAIPHVIPYQGSKRKIANQILEHIKYDLTGRFYEPFAGSAAMTLAAAHNGLGDGYVIGDKFEPLIELWQRIINDPQGLSREYEQVWTNQLDDPKQYFLDIRGQFNQTKDPVQFLYLVARCVKNAIRFNSNGEFNQGADNRRLGMKPEKLSKAATSASQFLRGRTEARSGDFMDILHDATENDLVYMDPPWQGTSQKANPRYAYLLDIDLLVSGMEDLNRRNVPYLLSFDGTCGDKEYGQALPEHLNLTHVGINAGRSSQATLLGRDDVTIESLYLSPALVEKNRADDTLGQLQLAV